MARPNVVNSAVANSGSSNSLAITIPAATEGNRMVVLVAQDGGASVFSPPAADGWSLISGTDMEPPTAQCTAAMFQKVAGASEGTSKTFTSDRIDAFVGIYFELDNNAELDDTTPSTDSADTGAPDPPSATPVDSETLCTPYYAIDRDEMVGATMTGYVLIAENDAGGGATDRVSIGIYEKDLTGTTAEDPPAVSLGDDNWVAGTPLWKDGSGAVTGYPSQYYDNTIVGNNPGVT